VHASICRMGRIPWTLRRVNSASTPKRRRDGQTTSEPAAIRERACGPGREYIDSGSALDGANAGGKPTGDRRPSAFFIPSLSPGFEGERRKTCRRHHDLVRSPDMEWIFG